MVRGPRICDPGHVRWLALCCLGACQFATHPVSGDAPPGPTGDAPLSSDGAKDAPSPGAGFVRLIDLDDTRITGGPHADFPLFISISASWLRDTSHGGDVARTDGFDIYFSADQAGATRLAHEVEVYAADSGTLTAWVKIPSLVPQSVLYLHYGDPAITTSQQSVAQVWSGGYAFVAHLETTGDATGASTSFSSSNVAGAAGKNDRAMTFDGSSSVIDAGSVTAIDDVFAAGGTAEGWFYANSYGEAAYGRLLDKGQENGWGLYVSDVSGFGSQSLAFRHGGAGGSIGSWFTSDGTVSLGAWHHAAVVYNQSAAGNAPLVYIDGVAMTTRQVDFPTGPMDSDAAANLTLGNRAGLDRTFDGVLDELRLSSVARGADYLATQYRNQNDPTAFYTINAPL